MVSSIERFHCIQDSQLGPNGVLHREVPLHTGSQLGHNCAHYRKVPLNSLEVINLTNSFFCSASRFEGSLNVDLNEITMNLVPYPKMHYLVSSITPLYALQDVSLPPRRSVVLLLSSCVFARSTRSSIVFVTLSLCHILSLSLSAPSDTPWHSQSHS